MTFVVGDMKESGSGEREESGPWRVGGITSRMAAEMCCGPGPSIRETDGFEAYYSMSIVSGHPDSLAV